MQHTNENMDVYLCMCVFTNPYACLIWGFHEFISSHQAVGPPYVIEEYS